MKELSIEEKAKRYDEALKVAKKYHNGTLKDVMETIFPELKESGDEDENIRKAMIKYFTNGKEYLSLTPYSREDYIDWLEKQGESKEINPSEFDSQLNRLLGQFKSLPKKELASSLSFYLNVVRNDGTYKEENQGEQKIPKFKVGDIIEYNGLGHNRYTIKDVCGTSHYINTNNARMDMSYTDANFELVEQKPILDVEIPFGAKDSELEEVTYDIPKGYHAEIEDNKVVIKQGEQKPANWFQELEDKLANATPQQLAEWKEKYFKEEPAEWSEEDEWCLEQINFLIRNSYSADDKVERLSNWVKSLRDRCTWKPSDAQMIVLNDIIINGHLSNANERILKGLQEQLKRIKD